MIRVALTGALGRMGRAMHTGLSNSGDFEFSLLLDVLEDNSYSPDHELMRKSMRDDTRRFLDILREREKTILMYRFAFDGDKKGN